MEFMKTFENWRNQISQDSPLSEELNQLTQNVEDIKDHFYTDLSFGTAGLRGKMGVGTNRMNIYTVGKTTQGLATWLLANYDSPSVCISFDTRNHSKEFAEVAAQIFAANNITVYLFSDCHPVPMLSFAVRHLNASAGVMITASHNPKEYNGYKVYNEKGNQITDQAADGITKEIQKIDPFTNIKQLSLEDAFSSGFLKTMPDDVNRSYYEKVESLSMRKDMIANKAKDLKIIYTPLHGSGNIPIQTILSQQGYSNVTIVKEQENPDGNFPTCPYPNPEIGQVYELATKLAKEIQPDLIFATDPDCDRIGVVEKNSTGSYEVFSGNQIGVLLTDYILKTKAELNTLPQNSAVVTTVVSTPMIKKIATAYHSHLELTLTGFKYIGEMIQLWGENQEYTFQFGFEESYGYLAGEFVRDKDAIIAASLICEMALYYREQGKSLRQALNSLFEEYGYYLEEQLSVTLNGSDGQEKIKLLVDNIRENYQSILSDEKIRLFEDFGKSIAVNIEESTKECIHLPKSDFVKFTFTDDSWLVIRPSGTEPKIKVYYGANATTLEASQNRMEHLKNLAKKVLQ